MINKHVKKRLSRIRRHRRVRAKVSGTAERPRLAVFRSIKSIYAQVIDDTAGKTLVAASDSELGKDAASIRKGSGDRKGKTALAFEVGKKIAEKAKAKGISSVVFDRGGFAYRGRIAALADGARENGLEF
jgi:large subunit ribosomal protein L18